MSLFGLFGTPTEEKEKYLPDWGDDPRTEEESLECSASIEEREKEEVKKVYFDRRVSISYKNDKLFEFNNPSYSKKGKSAFQVYFGLYDWVFNKITPYYTFFYKDGCLLLKRENIESIQIEKRVVEK